ncbi:PREDICTED: uncharacterized protein LOC109335084 isoform X2 [Lupinus angustifolius]|uniref:uncharacterized protein LOC109335084 isoform X2 n=1 Tax=Lupinus angustifolius TaxID=3871 RepID=UPI00092ED731|nr:PREDICTED: uncharacterized protein LOC109335084 isoform X2 [Lupinus angustifolius]
MSYVPPHKRHSNDKDKPSPLPELPPPPPPHTHFKHNPITRSSNSRSHSQKKINKIIYADHAVSEWFFVGLHHNDFPSFVKLHPISLESFQHQYIEKPHILLCTHTHLPEPEGSQERKPWEVVADKTLQNLIQSFEYVRAEMDVQDLEQEKVKPTFVARLGKILFHGAPSATQEELRQNLADGIMPRQLKRTFYTHIPTSYVDNMTKGETIKIGLDFTKEKDVFRVQLSDANRPESTISCKCSIMKELDKLKLYKIELSQVRQMVTDISCLTKNIDLRLMLCSKRILTVLKDDEMECIQSLIESAVLDPNVKGGLRWPLGKSTSGDRFSVCGVWHTIIKVYVNPSIKLKVRYVDRFDFRSSMGESASEVYLNLKGIISLLQVQKVDIGLISKELEDNLKLIWDHFLDCENFLG